MSVYLLSLILVMEITADITPEVNYHEQIGIPLAKKIMKAENSINATIDGRRIFGGAVTPRNAYPFLAGMNVTLVNNTETSVCGSSLVTANRLVTAGHCWRDFRHQASQFLVILGSQFIASGGFRVATSHVLVHPRFNPRYLHNDIAIVYLPTRVPFSRDIMPISLPHHNLHDSFAGRWVITAGYGVTSDAQFKVPVDTLVRHVQLQVMTVKECKSKFTPHWVQRTNICTSGSTGGGICRGDSGGPLFIFRKGKPVLVGITSFGSVYGCEIRHPSVFTRVTSFYSFIMKNL